MPPNIHCSRLNCSGECTLYRSELFARTLSSPTHFLRVGHPATGIASTELGHTSMNVLIEDILGMKAKTGQNTRQTKYARVGCCQYCRPIYTVAVRTVRAKYTLYRSELFERTLSSPTHSSRSATIALGRRGPLKPTK